MLHTKSFDIDVKNIKETTVDGVKVGIVRGFATTNEEDRDEEIISAFAFKEKLNEAIGRGIVSMPMFFLHSAGQTIGGFPLKLMAHADNGLIVEGHINLETENGREKFALARQKIFSFSVGFNIINSFHEEDENENEGKRRRLIITKGELMEISIVPIPSNVSAKIDEVKGATAFKDLPLASFEMTWNSSAANTRVRTKTGSTESPSASYRNAFFWFDSSSADKFGSYKLPFVDVVDGELKAVPRGIFAAAGALSGARGGVNIPEADMPAVIRHVNRYYKKMDRTSPLGKSLNIDELSKVQDFEQYLKIQGVSQKDSKNFISRLKGVLKAKKANHQTLTNEEIGYIKAMAEDIKGITEKLKLK